MDNNMYRAPVPEIAFTLKQVAGLSDAIGRGLMGELTDDLVDAILEEAGHFAGEEIAPLNAIGDRHGTPLKDGAVTMPPGWRQVYRSWCEAGWNGLTAPQEFGGQGLPFMLAAATGEMWNAASMAFGIGPLLTAAAIDVIHAYAPDALKRLYLPKLVSGEWTGTMNMTEPQAGSDLGTVATRAEPAGDGSYRLFGEKIFITYGEHDLTENIVHMVLARIAGAPAGSRGLSLFLVPKVLPSPDGSLGPRNDVVCRGVEHKLGIHGSPTCTIIFGDGLGDGEPGAVGWLVGEANRGLATMFTMMNHARLMVGIQGVGVAERALQQASTYAAERRQGRAPGAPSEAMSPIVEHPDVRRMLLTMRGLTAASRAICHACAHAIDMARALRAQGGAEAEHWQMRANLLTPVAKAFASDCGFEVASLGVQVHGGMGYIEETGAAQHLRDARIAQIYEGSNGIQAIDLVTRKLGQADGGQMRGFIDELRGVAEAARASNRPDFGRMGERVRAALDDLHAGAEHLLALQRDGRHAEALAGATPFLRMFGLAAGGAWLAKAALASGEEDSPAARLRIATARAFAERLCPETAAIRFAIVDGAEAVAGVDPGLLASQ
jgi:acyl-CoA dehydrogenase